MVNINHLFAPSCVMAVFELLTFMWTRYSSGLLDFGAEINLYRVERVIYDNLICKYIILFIIYSINALRMLWNDAVKWRNFTTSRLPPVCPQMRQKLQIMSAQYGTWSCLFDFLVITLIFKILITDFSKKPNQYSLRYFPFPFWIGSTVHRVLVSLGSEE